METTATVTITPRMMAEAFWSMDSEDQASFFDELADVIAADYSSGNRGAYGLGELQWFWLRGDLMMPAANGAGAMTMTRAGHMLQTMAAPLYLHTLRAAEHARGW